MNQFIAKPANFSFRNTLYSHGWSDLAPFSLDEEKWELSYIFRREDGAKPFLAVISETEKKIKINVPGRAINKSAAKKLVAETKRILRLDENLEEFYNITHSEKSLRWIGKTGTGRLIRSPSVFEDLIKTICTTNCSWALTKIMVTNLVEKLGEKGPSGYRTFPTPHAMASKNERFYREEIKAGYRAPYFVELSRLITNGELDPESWLASDLGTDELKKEMKSVKGVGDYAAENLLKLVGRYDGLALDSWLRAEYSERYKKGRKCSDKTIERHYAKFGRWKGLVIWFDMTQRFLDTRTKV